MITPPEIVEVAAQPTAAIRLTVGPESGPDSSRWQTVLHRPLVRP